MLSTQNLVGALRLQKQKSQERLMVVPPGLARRDIFTEDMYSVIHCNEMF